MVSRINKNGRDPSCCQTRYHQCCDHVNGTPVLNNPITTPRPQTTKPTPVTPATPRSVCPKTTPSNISKLDNSLKHFKVIYIIRENSNLQT